MEAAQCSTTKVRQFGLAHLLGLMVVFSAAFSLAGVFVTIVTKFGKYQPPDIEIWGGIAGYGAVFFLYVAVWTGPAVRACFLTRKIVSGCLAMLGVWLLVSFIVATITVLLMVISNGFNSTFHVDWQMTLDIVVGIFTHLACFALVLTTSLLVLRSCGYVLIRNNRRKKIPSSESVAFASTGTSPFAEPASEPDTTAGNDNTEA